MRFPCSTHWEMRSLPVPRATMCVMCEYCWLTERTPDDTRFTGWQVSAVRLETVPRTCWPRLPRQTWLQRGAWREGRTLRAFLRCREASAVFAQDRLHPWNTASRRHLLSHGFPGYPDTG